MKVLVCGSTGFIGRNIVDTLSKIKGIKVTAVFHKRPPYTNKNVDFVEANLTLAKDVERVVKTHDIVIQAAAKTTGVKDILEHPYIHVTDNAIMNSLILKSCYDNNIKKFIFFSCSVIYQTKENPFQNIPVVESDFSESNEIFPSYFGVGWTKIYIEKMCEFYSRLGRTKHYIIRHSNIYGPYDKFDLENSHVLGATINKVLDDNTNEISVWGDGSEERDLLYISDLVDSVVKLLSFKDKSFFYIFNIGSGSVISIKRLTTLIMGISGIKDKKVVYDALKPSVKTSISLDCSKAKIVLGWYPKISLENGIENTISWYKKIIK